MFLLGLYNNNPYACEIPLDLSLRRISRFGWVPSNVPRFGLARDYVRSEKQLSGV